ncbi:hypothetical protein Q4Q39_02665 [Flavivirga amylovorans]|uniref:DUF4945 domain-containing protein n=1 Tax=Flavivirga amylovorans TaxID=870486 RepID=A0ABT8WX87_9FLAO|nr:hypothetical protein [Flavivirga amylovorans]MDO5986296.1 hypothetical protein [Flavivirga amylovorans]
MKLYIKALFVVFCMISCDDIIEVEDISNKEVIALAPSNDVVLKATEVIFTWEVLEDAETYHLQIATPTFENAQQIVKDSILVGTSFLTTLDFKDYQWRIRAENSGYITSYTQQSFRVEE